MNQNVRYLVIGAVVIAVIIVGYLIYEEQESGVDIDVGQLGVATDLA
ncbi:MAG: hypothetical protein WEB93_00575 [Sphingomonadales bacterium]